MADTRVVIDVDLNTSPAAKGLRDLQREINAFTSSLNKNNITQSTAARQYSDQLMQLVNSSQLFTAETVRMRTAAGQLDQTLSKGKVTMGQFFSARFLKDSTAAAQVLSLANARASALQTQFIATSAAANGMRDAIAIRPYQAFNSALAVSTEKIAIHRAMLMQATTHMINFGKNTQWAGRQLMVGFTIPLTIFGGVAGKVFKEIETELVNFKKVYGDAFTPPEELDRNIEGIKELAKEYTKYGIAVKDTIGLAAKAAATGAQNADLIDATRESTRLATLGQMEQNEALETTIALQTAFNISGQELSKTINFLNMVENQTVVTLQDLAAAIPRVAPVIKGLGGSVEDMAVMLAAMREGGVTAEQGANALKSGLASLINPTDRAIEKLEKMGIALDSIVQANRGDLMGTVQDFAMALDSLDEFSRQQALEQVFGKFQYARLGALFNNIIRDGSQASRVMDTAAMSAEQLAASAEKELGAIEQATSVQFTAAMERLKLAIAPIGETFMQLSIPIIQFLGKIIEKFNELPDFAKKFATFATVIVGVVIPAGTMFLGLLMNLAGTLVKFGSIVGIAFKGFTSGGLRGAINAVSQAINYMSLEDIDASLAAKQLGDSTIHVNNALINQVSATAKATLGIQQLGGAYAALIARMREAAALSTNPMGAFVVPGAAASQARRGPIRRNKGGSIPYMSGGGKTTVPGVGNTDTVPAMLTPGEFVVNKKATRQNYALLEAINNGDVQYRNKGGGIASPGRMFYGRVPAGLSADDLLASFSLKGSDLEQALNVQRAEMGRGKVSLPTSFAPSQVGIQVAKRTAEEIIEPAKRSAYRILQKIGVAPKIDSRGSVGYHTRYNQQLKPENNGIPASLLRRDLLNPQYDSFAVLRRQANEWNRLNPNDPVDANAIIRRFTNSLEDLGENIIKDDISQVLYRQAIGNRRFLKEIDKPSVQDARYSVPAAVDALKKNGYTQVSLPSVPKGFKVKVKDINGSPTVQILDRDGNIVNQTPLYLEPNNFIKDQSGKANIWVNDPSEGIVNLRGMQGEVGRPGSIDPRFGYKSITTPKIDGADIQFAHANKGGLIQLGGKVSSSKNFYGRFNAKTIELFTKWISSQPSSISAMKANVGKDAALAQKFKAGFRKSKKPEVIQRATFMENIPKAGDTLSLGALASFSPKNVSVGQHLSNSSLRQNYEFAHYQLGVAQKQLKEYALRLKKMKAGNLPSWAPENKYISPITKKVGPQAYIDDIEQRFIPHSKKIVKNSKATIRDYKKYTPTIVEVQTPKGTIRANLDDIVDPKNQQFMGKKTSEQERILHNAVVKVLSIGQESGGITRIKAKLVSSEYPGILATPQKRNLGGPIFDSRKKIVPGMGNTDTVPAMLTPGEFVVNKEATKSNINLLHAINNGSIAGFNNGGAVGRSTVIPPMFPDGSPKFPMSSGASVPVDIKNVSDPDAAKANQKAAKASGMRGGIAGFGIQMGLGMAGFMGGSALGGAVGGDTGAIIGGIAGSLLPMLLPRAIGKLPTGGMLPAMGGKAGTSAMGGAASTANIARFLPMLMNPYTAAIAAVTAAALGTVVTLKKMGESNIEEYEAGRQLAKAMSTSAEEISKLGPTARQRIQNIDSYLNASEAQLIQQEYATKISKAKTDAERKRLEQERNAAISERGNQTRRKAIEGFYEKEIDEARKLQMSQEHLRRLYEQRNISLGKRFQEEAQFEIDKTFGAQFITGLGKQQFERFTSVRQTAEGMRSGDVSKAEANTITRLADAAYGMSMSFERIAERDMASKLAQYVLSGTMTQDQAASVAEAIGAELNDLQIGKNIRQELTGIVGIDGMTAKYSPGTVAMQLAQENTKRVEELRRLTISRAGAMFTTNPDQLRDQASIIGTLGGPVIGGASIALSQRSRTFDENKFKKGDPMALNIFNQFFSGMADEFRRNVGSLIELQANEVQMLEENIAAVALNYDDLIAKASTLEEAERLRLERARTLAKLQERSDEAREKQLQMAFGTQDEFGINRMLRPYRERRERSDRIRIETAQSRDRLAGIEPINFDTSNGFAGTVNNAINNLLTRTVAGLDLALWNIGTFFTEKVEQVAGTIEQTFPSSMAQLMTNETVAALQKAFEGTPLQAQFAVFQEQFNAEGSPELYRIYSEFLNDPEFAANVLNGFNNAMMQVTAAAESGKIGSELAEIINQNLKDAMFSLTLPTEVVGEYGRLLSSLDATQIVELDAAISSVGKNYGIRTQEQALERFLPILSQLGQLSGIKMPGLGGKSMIEAMFGNQETLRALGQNDEALEGLMKFIQFVSELPQDLQISFLEDKSISQMILAGQKLDKFNPIKFKKNYKEIKQLLKSGIIPEGRDFEDGTRLIELNIAKLNEIEDPEIKATLTAEVSPLFDQMLSLLQKLPNVANIDEARDILDQAAGISSVIATKTEGAKESEGMKQKKSGGGTKSDPLGEMLRSLRDQISAREKIGQDIYAANEKAKGTFSELRSQGANEAVIEYLNSLSPEDALRVGAELLKDQRKLNSLMGLMAQNAIAQQREAAKVEQERAKSMSFLANSRVMGGMSAIFGSDALNDPEFIQGMMTAAGGRNPNKEQRQFLAAYNARKKAERDYMIAQMPASVMGETQRNRLEQRSQIQMANEGLNAAEIEVGLGNEAIRLAIEERIKDGKSIGPEIINAIRGLAASQKTPIEQINDAIDDILFVYTQISNILQSSMDSIEEYSIKPLETNLQSIQKQTQEFSEQQRRLSNSLTKLQEKENELKEQQNEQEKKINDAYDLRIEALEKINSVNKEAEELRRGQLDVASALSRGDVGAAAKAAQELQARLAQAKREEAIQAVRDKKEKEIEEFKNASEQQLKNLTIEVNGQLLNREQIQERIDGIEEKIYQNSLLEYEIQQKISAERERQQKIAEAQQKVSRASNIVSRIGELGNQNLTQSQRSVLLESIKAEVKVLGGTGSDQLISYLNANRQDLISGNVSDLAFDLAGSLNTFLGGFSQDFANLISPEMFTVNAADLFPDGTIDLTQVSVLPPDISSILQSALNSASASITTSLDELDAELTTFQEEVIKKNPFDKLLEGTEKLTAKAKEFLSSIPKAPGSGGGSEGPKTTKAVALPGEESFRLNKPMDYKFIDEWLAKQAGRELAGKKYEENKMGLGRGFGAGDTWRGAGRGVGTVGADPMKIAGAEFASPQDMVDYILSGFYLQGKTKEKPGTAIGNDIIQGITDAILEGAISYDASVVAVEVERALRAENAFNTGSPSKAMIPLGKDISSGIIDGILAWFISPIKGIWSSIQSFFTKETGTESGESTKTGIFGKNLISGLFSGMLNALMPESILQTLSTGFNYLTQSIKTLLGIGPQTGEEISNSPKGMGKTSAMQILSGFVSGLLPESIISFIKDPIGTLLNTIASALGITDKTQGKEGSPFSQGKEIVSKMISGFAEMLNIKTIANTISEYLNNFQLAVNEFFFGKGNKEESWVFKLGKSVTQAIVDGFKSIDLVAELKAIVRNATRGLPEIVKNYIPADWKYFGGPIKRAFGGMIGYQGSREPAPGMMFGGRMKKFAMGSFVPGIGNTDVVPAMLTPGEFVVRKSVAQTYGPLLNALNSDVFPRMTMTSLMPSSSSAPSDQVSYNYQINVSVNGSNASPDEIANVVMSKIRMTENTKVRGYNTRG